MDVERLRELLESVNRGETGIDEAMDALKSLPFEDLGFSKIDTHRHLRQGFPEVVFAEGKTAGQIISILEAIRAKGGNVLVTRVDAQQEAQIREAHPDVIYHEMARALVLQNRKVTMRDDRGRILVITAGTSDIPVAEEACVTAEFMGNAVDRLYDVGVAGIHRLLGFRKELMHANVLIVAAGMEGALPSVVSGLVARPVIAVPTSIGYGTSFGGISALLGMLNSCASGVTVVNIDNGFGAGYVASLINQSGEGR